MVPGPPNVDVGGSCDGCGASPAIDKDCVAVGGNRRGGAPLQLPFHGAVDVPERTTCASQLDRVSAGGVMLSSVAPVLAPAASWWEREEAQASEGQAPMSKAQGPVMMPLPYGTDWCPEAFFPLTTPLPYGTVWCSDASLRPADGCLDSAMAGSLALTTLALSCPGSSCPHSSATAASPSAAPMPEDGPSQSRHMPLPPQVALPLLLRDCTGASGAENTADEPQCRAEPLAKDCDLPPRLPMRPASA
mmetsp:Transcript_27781/g.70268  ORF Transcript_27781/g.70268 Transcript_27781/m.70268 type:complete len:247 (+) Transcript_27781:117-857(+)